MCGQGLMCTRPGEGIVSLRIRCSGATHQGLMRLRLVGMTVQESNPRDVRYRGYKPASRVADARKGGCL